MKKIILLLLFFPSVVFAQGFIPGKNPIVMTGITTPGPSLSSQARMYFDISTNHIMVSENGGSYSALATTTGSVTTSGPAAAGQVGTWTSSVNLTGSNGLTFSGGLFSVNTPAVTSTAEVISKFTVSDDSTAAITISNGTATDSKLTPIIEGFVDVGSTTQAINIGGSITAANDTGTSPIISFVGYRGTAPNTGTGAIITRPLFSLTNWSTEVAEVSATGAWSNPSSNTCDGATAGALCVQDTAGLTVGASGNHGVITIKSGAASKIAYFSMVDSSNVEQGEFGFAGSAFTDSDIANKVYLYSAARPISVQNLTDVASGTTVFEVMDNEGGTGVNLISVDGTGAISKGGNDLCSGYSAGAVCVGDQQGLSVSSSVSGIIDVYGATNQNSYVRLYGNGTGAGTVIYNTGNPSASTYVAATGWYQTGDSDYTGQLVLETATAKTRVINDSDVASGTTVFDVMDNGSGVGTVLMSVDGAGLLTANGGFTNSSSNTCNGHLAGSVCILDPENLSITSNSGTVSSVNVWNTTATNNSGRVNMYSNGSGAATFLFSTGNPTTNTQVGQVGYLGSTAVSFSADKVYMLGLSKTVSLERYDDVSAGSVAFEFADNVTAGGASLMSIDGTGAMSKTGTDLCNGHAAGTVCVNDSEGFAITTSSATVAAQIYSTAATNNASRFDRYANGTGYALDTWYTGTPSAASSVGSVGYYGPTYTDADLTDKVGIIGFSKIVQMSRYDDVASGSTAFEWRDNITATGSQLLALDGTGAISKGGSDSCNGHVAGSVCVFDSQGFVVSSTGTTTEHFFSSAANGSNQLWEYTTTPGGTGQASTIFATGTPTTNTPVGAVGYYDTTYVDADLAGKVLLSGIGKIVHFDRGDDVASGTTAFEWMDNSSATGVQLAKIDGIGKMTIADGLDARNTVAVTGAFAQYSATMTANTNADQYLFYDSTPTGVGSISYYGSAFSDTDLADKVSISTTSKMIQFSRSDDVAAGTIGFQFMDNYGATGVSLMGVYGDGHLKHQTSSMLMHTYLGKAGATLPVIADGIWNATSLEQAFTIKKVKGRLKTAGTGAGNYVGTITDGTNTCTFTLACTTAAGAVNITVANGAGTGCVYASAANLTVSSTTDCTTPPQMTNVDFWAVPQ
jgi:hypothetical protein